jgi:hypothetical protein
MAMPQLQHIQANEKRLWAETLRVDFNQVSAEYFLTSSGTVCSNERSFRARS